MDVLNGGIDALRSAYSNADENRYMSSKSEIVDYYRSEYPTDWRTRFTNSWLDAMGLENNKKNRNTASRQVQGDRAFKESRQHATKDKYKKLGKLLPPNGKDARTDTKATLWISNKPYYKEMMDLVFSQDELSLLTGDEPFDAIVDKYGINPDDVEEIEVHSIGVAFI